jgi:cellulose synthase/poly-beta-1,6-N-acetylglucosamine synthase-like glycosyltransferase
MGVPLSKPFGQACFVDGWREAFLDQALQLVPFVANGTVVGIFFGDEVSATAETALSWRLTLRTLDKLLLQCAFRRFR